MTLGTNDVVRIVLSFLLPETVTAQLVWHYIVTAGTGGVPGTILAAILAAANSAFNGIEGDMVTGADSVEIDLLKWDFTANRFDGLANSVATSISGTSNASMAPHGVGPLVSFFTDTGRRRGRKFLPGYSEDSFIDGNLQAAPLSRLITFNAGFNDDVISGGITLAPCNFNTDELSPLFESVAEWSNTSAVATIAAYQRRRKPGVGI